MDHLPMREEEEEHEEVGQERVEQALVVRQRRVATKLVQTDDVVDPLGEVRVENLGQLDGFC
eukprot:1468743-Pleurochrysis_carterae.AAC.1